MYHQYFFFFQIKEPEEQEFTLEHLYMHKNFSRENYLSNDIGLVKIKGEIKLGNNVKPICLAPSKHFYKPELNCSISGWGSTARDSQG